MRRRPSQDGNGVLRIKVVTFNVQADSPADMNLRASAEGIGALQFPAGHNCAIAGELRRSVVSTAESFDEWIEAASRGKSNSRSCHHRVMVNLSRAAVANELDCVRRCIAGAEMAGQPQPASEVGSPGRLPTQRTHVAAAGCAGSARELRISERGTAGKIKTGRHLREPN